MEVDAKPRREISIVLVGQEVGIHPGGKAGQAGRELLKLWRQKYNKGPQERPPQRDTIFRGKPYKENAYFEEDYDIVHQALRTVCRGSA